MAKIDYMIPVFIIDKNFPSEKLDIGFIEEVRKHLPDIPENVEFIQDDNVISFLVPKTDETVHHYIYEVNDKTLFPISYLPYAVDIVDVGYDGFKYIGNMGIIDTRTKLLYPEYPTSAKVVVSEYDPESKFEMAILRFQLTESNIIAGAKQFKEAYFDTESEGIFYFDVDFYNDDEMRNFLSMSIYDKKFKLWGQLSLNKKVYIYARVRKDCIEMFYDYFDKFNVNNFYINYLGNGHVQLLPNYNPSESLIPGYGNKYGRILKLVLKIYRKFFRKLVLKLEVLCKEEKLYEPKVIEEGVEKGLSCLR